MNPFLLSSFIAAAVFEIVFPIVVGYYIHRRFGVSWRYFLYGALIFFLFQLITRVPLVQVAQAYLGPTLRSSQTFLYLWFAVLALTAGLFEEVGRYLGYRFLVKNNKTWQVGLMYGAGHGGLESILLIGILGVVNVVVLMALPSGQSSQIDAARQQLFSLAWWMPLPGAYERFITLFFHIALSVLVLQTFLRHSFRWLLLAIALHALVDFGAVVLVQQISAVWVEAALTLTFPLSLGIIYYFRPHPVTSEPIAVP